MQHILLLATTDIDVVQSLMKWYTYRSVTANQIQRTLIERHNKRPRALVGQDIEQLVDMANDFEAEVPDLEGDHSSALAGLGLKARAWAGAAKAKSSSVFRRLSVRPGS